MGHAVLAPDLLGPEVLDRVVVADLAGDADGQVGGVEDRDRARHALAGADGRPHPLDVGTGRGLRPETGDGDARAPAVVDKSVAHSLSATFAMTRSTA